MSSRSRTRYLKRPSAMGLRQMFPVQMKRTLFTNARRADAPLFKPRTERIQVNGGSIRVWAAIGLRTRLATFCRLGLTSAHARALETISISPRMAVPPAGREDGAAPSAFG